MSPGPIDSLPEEVNSSRASPTSSISTVSTVKLDEKMATIQLSEDPDEDPKRKSKGGGGGWPTGIHCKSFTDDLSKIGSKLNEKIIAIPVQLKTGFLILQQKSARIYETTPPKTMKYVALISALLLFFGVLSLVLAQRDEAAQSKYGMAFPLTDNSPSAEQRVASSKFDSIPGEGMEPKDEESSTPLPEGLESEGKPEMEDEEESGPTPDLLISQPSEDESQDKPEGAENPRIVFIERLMGMHLSAPVTPPPSSDLSPSDPMSPPAPGDKVKAKWASRMRKFTIPIDHRSPPNPFPHGPPSPPQAPSSEAPNPMLRFAAAAMMSRLVAAAARAQMESQAREAVLARSRSRPMSPEREDVEEKMGALPLLLASLAEGAQEGPILRRRGPPQMYGRPLPRPRPFGQPSLPIHHHSHRPAASSMPRRTFLPPGAPVQSQAPRIVSPAMRQFVGRRLGSAPQPPQAPTPILLMVAVPIQRDQGAQLRRFHGLPTIQRTVAAASPVRPFYPNVAYPSPVTPYATATPIYARRPAMAAIPMAPQYTATSSPFVATAVQRPSFYPASPALSPYAHRQVPAYSHVRPVIEVPVEVPVPVPFHVPVGPLAARGAGGPHVIPIHRGHGIMDQIQERIGGSEQDHMIIMYDAELQHDAENGGGRQEGNGMMDGAPHIHHEGGHPSMSINRGSGGMMKDQLMSADENKMKIWRELMEGGATQDGPVRYLPVAIANEEGEGGQAEAAESSAQPAFIVLAEDEHEQ